MSLSFIKFPFSFYLFGSHWLLITYVYLCVFVFQIFLFLFFCSWFLVTYFLCSDNKFYMISKLKLSWHFNPFKEPEETGAGRSADWWRLRHRSPCVLWCWIKPSSAFKVLLEIESWGHTELFTACHSGSKKVKSCLWRRDKMSEEHMDMHYISLHRCIRNTPSDPEGLTEHQLRAGRNPWSPERNTWIYTKLKIGPESLEWECWVQNARQLENS